MKVRDSRLLITVITGTLVVMPLACGGTDSGTSDSTTTNNTGSNPASASKRPTPNNDGGSTTTNAPLRLHLGSSGGADTSADPTEQAICDRIADKITTCQAELSCTVDVDVFVQQCLDSGAFTQDDADQLVALPCASIDSGLCEPDDAGNSGDGSTASGGLYGPCAAGYTCDTLSSDLAFCSIGGAVPTDGADCSGAGVEDCDDGQTCLTDANNNSYCVDLCDSPPCPSGTVCTNTGDSAGDLVCLSGDGSIPDAEQCDDSGNCPVDSWCFEVDNPDGSANYLCLKFCFADTSAESTHASVQQMLKD